MDAFIRIRRDLHMIPELGYQEFKTQAYLLNYLNKFKSDKVEIKTWKTGIFAFIKGLNSSKTIAYRTDIDGLPMKEETNLPFSSIHNGKMHACGHDFHMSIALGVFTYFAKNPINNNLLFIFQPAEEEPGGAFPMLNTDIYKQYSPDFIMALHIAPELPVGTISTKKNTLFAACSELDINIQGKNSHGARPHLGTDSILIASQLINQLQSIVSRNTNPLDSAVITIGKINGGVARNVTSKHVSLEGTIRTLNSDTMVMIKNRISKIASGLEMSHDCQIDISFKHDYIEVSNHPNITDEFIDFISETDYVKFKLADITMASEDFGYFLKDTCGFMFWLGVDSKHDLHTTQISPKEEAIPLAIQTVCDFINYKFK